MELLKLRSEVDFMGRRRTALVFSAVLLAVSLVSLAARGLELGIDFTGGTLIEVGYPDTADLGQVRTALGEAGFDGAVVQHFGTTRDVLVRLAPREDVSKAELSTQVVNALRQSTDGELDLRRVEFVGPQVGEELTEDGGLAMLIALGAILAYVGFRFEIRFSLGAVAALGLPVALTGAAALSGGQAPENTMGWSGIFFPIALGYAVLGQNLLGVDAVIRRTLQYALMTVFVGVGYAAALVGFERLFSSYVNVGHGAFLHVTVSIVTAAILLPLRDRLQAVVDRLFFRAAYDFRRLVERASQRLASVTSLPVIATEIEGVVSEALHPEWLVLFVRARSDDHQSDSSPSGTNARRRSRSRSSRPPNISSKNGESCGLTSEAGRGAASRRRRMIVARSRPWDGCRPVASS